MNDITLYITQMIKIVIHIYITQMFRNVIMSIIVLIWPNIAPSCIYHDIRNIYIYIERDSSFWSHEWQPVYRLMCRTWGVFSARKVRYQYDINTIYPIHMIMYSNGSTYRWIPYSTFSQTSLATLDGEIVDPDIAVKFEIRMHLKYTVHKPNTYNVWYIKCESIFWQNWDEEISTEMFHLYCLPDTLIQIFHGLFWFALNIFHLPLNRDIFVSNDSTRNEFSENCRVMSFSNPCDISHDVIPSHVK